MIGNLLLQNFNNSKQVRIQIRHTSAIDSSRKWGNSRLERSILEYWFKLTSKNNSIFSSRLPTNNMQNNGKKWKPVGLHYQLLLTQNKDRLLGITVSWFGIPPGRWTCCWSREPAQNTAGSGNSVGMCRCSCHMTGVLIYGISCTTRWRMRCQERSASSPCCRKIRKTQKCPDSESQRQEHRALASLMRFLKITHKSRIFIVKYLHVICWGITWNTQSWIITTFLMRFWSDLRWCLVNS